MPSPPSGVLTFLFTDVERSTRLWETHEAEMRSAMRQHDRLLRNSFAAGNGYVFATGGDSFAVAFADPAAAAAAGSACEAQQVLEDVELADSGPLRIRAALHTGTADERDGDYFGPPLNRTSRLLSLAYGGQTLVSAATAELIRERLPAEASLSDLGRHRLRDLSEPEHIYQLAVAGHDEFPALASLDAYPHNLPVQLTDLVGRREAVAEVLALLGEARLVTLTGVGGVGKTRIALQAAADIVGHHRDGTWLVDLAPLTNPEAVAATLAKALGFQPSGNKPVVDQVTDFISTKSMLVVLDNCKHLIDEVAGLVTRLLTSAPGLVVLATSREGLGVPGEQLWRVPSLGGEAADLFVERARAVRAGFSPTAHQVAIDDICRRLDGIPLALELAAARLSVLSPGQLAERLSDRFRLLTGGSRTALPRQRTLRATMDWSYDLLQPDEKALLRRLSVFYGGFDIEAAEAVGSGGKLERWDVLDILGRLVDASLVSTEDADPPRFRLLETVRQYAAERLVDAGDVDEVRRRHAAHYSEQARSLDRDLVQAGGDVFLVATRDTDNFRAAITWALEAEARTAVDMVPGLGRLWFQQGLATECLAWAKEALAATSPDPTPARVTAMGWLAYLELVAGDRAEGRRLAVEVLETASRLELGDEITNALNLLGVDEMQMGRVAEAVNYLRASVTAGKRHGSYRGEAALMNLGLAALLTGDETTAVETLREMRSADVEDRRTSTVGKSLEAMMAMRADDLDEAERLMEAAITEEPTPVWRNVFALWAALRDLLAGDAAQARRRAAEARAALSAMGHSFGVMWAVTVEGRAAGRIGGMGDLRDVAGEWVEIARNAPAFLGNLPLAVAEAAVHDRDWMLAAQALAWADWIEGRNDVEPLPADARHVEHMRREARSHLDGVDAAGAAELGTEDWIGWLESVLGT